MVVLSKEKKRGENLSNKSPFIKKESCRLNMLTKNIQFYTYFPLFSFTMYSQNRLNFETKKKFVASRIFSKNTFNTFIFRKKGIRDVHRFFSIFLFLFLYLFLFYFFFFPPTCFFDLYKVVNAYLRAVWHAIAPHSSRISPCKETRIASASPLFLEMLLIAARKFTDGFTRSTSLQRIRFLPNPSKDKARQGLFPSSRFIPP